MAANDLDTPIDQSVVVANTNHEKPSSPQLEKQLCKVITNCKSIIKSNRSVIRKPAGEGKNEEKKKKLKPKSEIIESKSKVTLEKVAQEMSQILEKFKDHLANINPTLSREDSFSDVGTELDQMVLKNIALKKTLKPTSGLSTNRSENKAVGPKNKNQQGLNEQRIVKPINKTRNSKTSKQLTNRSKLQSEIIPTRFSEKPPSINKFSATKPQYNGFSREIYDPVGPIKDEVQRAIRDEKTFTIRGCFPAIRRALLSRGWVEKFIFSFREHSEMKKYQYFSLSELIDLLRIRESRDVAALLIKSKLLKDQQVDLYYSYNYEAFKECPDKIKLTKINKFRRNVFSYTSKKGLCESAKQSFWFQIPGVAEMNHPRSYSLTKEGDTGEFIKDFYLTAAMSLLKWVQQTHLSQQCKIVSHAGKIPLRIFEFALTECYKFLKKAEHADIDNEIQDAFEHEWTEFVENFYKTVHIGNHFKGNPEDTENDLVRKANFVLSKLAEHWPYLEMDGLMNIWILKPTNGSQGVGIHICRTLKYVLETVKTNPNKRYIIQKYIERPFLIYNTKFDIRQWFLISSASPLTIWMYKHCYLRFSSQTYNLRKLHESIHLTNNSVQARYCKNNSKDLALPTYNMWDSTRFKSYLSDIGFPNVFNDIIYPGMTQSVTAAVLMHYEKIDKRKNCFELYGADFILTEDFKPWLLEINSNPALNSSTPVTANMCPVVMEDVIKVVIDYERNHKANTGGFELVYHGDPRSKPRVVRKGFHITCSPLKEEFFFTPTSGKSTGSLGKEITRKGQSIRQLGLEMTSTLENLLELLKQEKAKRIKRKNKNVETIKKVVNTISTQKFAEEDELILPVESVFNFEQLII